MEDEISALREEVVNLRRALKTRDIIGQAKGVLMARTGCDAEQAFAMLSAQSQRENRKLADIAAEIAQRAIRTEADSAPD